jgi:hypothetical protein
VHMHMQRACAARTVGSYFGGWPAAVSAAGAARLQRGSSLGFGETPDRVTFNPAQAELADREVLRCWAPWACRPGYARSLTSRATALHIGQPLGHQGILFACLWV